MDILSKIFGSSQKVKIMRLFLFNPNEAFDNDLVKDKTQVSIATVRKMTKMFEKIGFLQKKTFKKKVKQSRGRGRDPKWIKRTVQGWALNADFPYLGPLYKLLIGDEPFTSKEIMAKLSGVGKVSLVIIAGVFIQQGESRIDLLIVGDNLKPRAIARAVRNMESEIGKELSYAMFSETEFKYRLNVYDKLVRDLLDYPHEVVVDKLGLRL